MCRVPIPPALLVVLPVCRRVPPCCLLACGRGCPRCCWLLSLLRRHLCLCPYNRLMGLQWPLCLLCLLLHCFHSG